jgi:hypothetical protein
VQEAGVDVQRQQDDARRRRPTARGVGFEDLAQAYPEDWMSVGDDDGDDRLHP